MKKTILALFAIFLVVSLTAFGQYSSSSSDQTKSDTTTSDRASSKSVSLSGTIGDDGKTFTDRHGKTWTISNPDAVKGHEGHKVMLKAKVDPDKNEINVVSLKMQKAKGKETAPMSEQPPK